MSYCHSYVIQFNYLQVNFNNLVVTHVLINCIQYYMDVKTYENNNILLSTLEMSKTSFIYAYSHKPNALCI